MTRTATSIALTALGLVACHSAQQPQPSPKPEQATAGTPGASSQAAPTQPAPLPSNTSAASPAQGTTKGIFSFDSDGAGAAPGGFSFGRTGSGSVGRWVVRADADAPSKPNILAQLDSDDTDYRFPVAVADGISLRDLRLSVRCKPVSGRVDQACGLVFRYHDANNYLLTRANALENNVRLYYVKGGHREQVASWNGTVSSNVWHEYIVEARGDHFQIFWDGRKVLDHHDSTFLDAGGVGVWTKADSVTYFDDLAVAPLRQTAQDP